MKRLRHPIREPFGKAGLIVAVLALVFAMLGGAYAAGGLTKSQEKQVTKIAKKYAGEPGAVGVAGANGKDGTNGTNGTNGAPGTSGQSVTVAESANAFGTHCTGTGSTGKGGSEFKVGAGTPVYACNGKNGTTGFTKTLPSEASEFGTWATVYGPTVGGGPNWGTFSASFNIPLAEAPSVIGCETQPQPTTCGVHFIAPSGKELFVNLEGDLAEVAQRTPAPCPGTPSDPKADPGNLCVYVQNGLSTLHGIYPPVTLTPGGVVFYLYAVEKPDELISGSWAVTAE